MFTHSLVYQSVWDSQKHQRQFIPSLFSFLTSYVVCIHAYGCTAGSFPIFLQAHSFLHLFCFPGSCCCLSWAVSLSTKLLIYATPPPQKKSAWRSWLSLGIVFLWRAGGRCELQPDSIRSGSDTGPIVRQAAAASTSLAFSKIVAKGLTLRLAVCCVMWSYSLWCLLWFVGRKADGAALEDDITHWV